MRTTPQKHGEAGCSSPDSHLSLLMSCFCTSRLRSTEQAPQVQRNQDTRALKMGRRQHVQEHKRGLREKRWGQQWCLLPKHKHPRIPAAFMQQSSKDWSPATGKQRGSLSESFFFAPFLLVPTFHCPSGPTWTLHRGPRCPVHSCPICRTLVVG